MKELSIEGKATRYDRALKEAVVAHKDEDRHLKATLERIFPELKENEDERIRKWLIEMVEEVRKANPTNAEHNGICSEAIAWLEKKGEHKPIWSEEDEIALGDALWCCKQAASIAKDENDMGNAWYAEHWLKLLKERYTWKPSNEQLKGIEYAIRTLQHQLNVGDKRLNSLYNDLKKLKEE